MNDLSNRDDIDINVDLNNGDVSRGIGLINSHTLSQFKKSYFRDIDYDVKNDNISGGHCLINRHTLFEANNQNSIYSAKKSDGKFPNVSET